MTMKRMRNDLDMLKKNMIKESGKLSKQYAEETNVVIIEPDVAKFFLDHDSVNQALRSLPKFCVT